MTAKNPLSPPPWTTTRLAPRRSASPLRRPPTSVTPCSRRPSAGSSAR